MSSVILGTLLVIQSLFMDFAMFKCIQVKFVDFIRRPIIIEHWVICAYDTERDSTAKHYSVFQGCVGSVVLDVNHPNLSPLNIG